MSHRSISLGPEISGVLLTVLGKFLLADWLGLRLVFIVAAGLLWLAFVVARTRADPSVLGTWGFTSRDLGRSAARLLPFAVLAAIITLIYGTISGHLLMHWHMVWVFLLYPVWGLVQQFIVLALIAGTLKSHSRIPAWGIVLLTALVFAGVHVPSVPLIVASFAMALITTTVYLQASNLWTAGLFHGWVATLVYYFVLGQDPWSDVVSVWMKS